MTIVDALIVGIGGAISKAVLHLWLKDSPFALTATTSLADTLATTIKDLRTRRSVERQLDQIAERAADAIYNMLQKRPQTLSIERMSIVANAAGSTVESADFSASNLAKRNLNPEVLCRYLLEQTGSAGGNPGLTFNSQERLLYEDLLLEASQYIIDIASQLPAFTERTFSEVLSRQDQLLNVAADILAEVQRIRDGGDETSGSEAEFETRYRRACIRKLDEIHLYGVDVRQSSRRYRLTTAYVTLYMSDSLHSGAVASSDEDDFDVSDSLASPDALFAKAKRVIVRGSAGSGKTTLLHWLAVQSCSKAFDGDLSAWNRRVPFVIRLREYADQPLPTPEEFLASVSRLVAQDAPNKWTVRLMKQGIATLLIDGLDEIARARHREVYAWLDELIGEYPDIAVVVATRPHAGDAKWFLDRDFSDVTLQEMTRHDVEMFIDHWHEAAAENAHQADEAGDLERSAEGLKDALRKQPQVFRLATTPLLCAIICALNRERSQDIPNERAELYRACVSMFFRRDRERQVDVSAYPELSDRHRTEILADLAYWMLRNGLTEAPLEDASRRVRKTMETMRLITSPNATGAVEYFVERSGVLRMPSPGTIDFPHRSFQEYFAATAAISEGDIGFLAARADDELWRDTVVMCAELATPANADRLIEAILDRSETAGTGAAALVLVAASCRNMVLRFPEQSTSAARVRLALGKIVPPRNLTEARALASAGDLVVDQLQTPQKYYASAASCAARTLALIESDASLSMLRDRYATDGRILVLREVVRSGAYVADPKRYARLVLGCVRRLRLDDWVSNEWTLDVVSRGGASTSSLGVRLTLWAAGALLGGMENVTQIDFRKFPPYKWSWEWQVHLLDGLPDGSALSDIYCSNQCLEVLKTYTVCESLVQRGVSFHGS